MLRSRLPVLMLATAPILSGCFFVFIPGALIDKVAGAPKWCVGSNVKVGDRVMLNNAPALITKLHGESSYYCRNNPPDRQIGADAEWVDRTTDTRAAVPTATLWAWDQYEDGLGVLVWGCRDKDGGARGAIENCSGIVKNDDTWPGPQRPAP